jgi:histidinol phosphatase-like PHP family hydrolase
MYLYETHLHTVRCSACAVSPGPEYISLYKEKGYTGIIVTDHFFNGNTIIPRSLPWREWVNRFYRGYEETREEGERQGLDVFFGWEETFDGSDDYLIYGLDKSWLLEHPEVRSWSRAEQYKTVKEAGGCVVQAHPFRQRYYISRIILSSGCVDAVEAANAGNSEQSCDALAMRYAERIGLPATAGSDIHEASLVRHGDIFGVYLNKKMNSISDYVYAIKNNEIAGLKISQGRCDYHGDETISLPLVIRDRKDRIVSGNLAELLDI